MSTSDENENWDDWVEGIAELDSDVLNYKCLFCSETILTLQAVQLHMNESHHFSLQEYLSHWRLTQYEVIQFVNFVRSKIAIGVGVQSIIQDIDGCGKTCFKHDEYFKPVLQDDAFLYTLEAEDEGEDDTGIDQVNYDGNERDQADMIKKLQLQNESLAGQVYKLKEITRTLISESEEPLAHRSRYSKNHGKKVGIHIRDNDQYYFESYSHIGIHKEMLADKVRTNGYRMAMLENRRLFDKKVVLDVGCGTGILCMFAAQAGARKVIGVDNSELAYLAEDIVLRNGFSVDQITILKGKIEDVELPVDRVDVIVSEWMGYCLFYESMLDSVLYARDRWLLKADDNRAFKGHILPDVVSLHLQGARDMENRNRFWQNVYGFDMSPVDAKLTKAAAHIEIVAPEAIMTDRILLHQIDLNCIKRDDVFSFVAKFHLTVTEDGLFEGFVSTFDVRFLRDCALAHFFTTGVEGIPTHWKQVFFMIEDPFVVQKGQTVSGTWILRQNNENQRALDIDILYETTDGKTRSQVFHLK